MKAGKNIPRQSSLPGKRLQRISAGHGSRIRIVSFIILGIVLFLASVLFSAFRVQQYIDKPTNGVFLSTKRESSQHLRRGASIVTDVAESILKQQFTPRVLQRDIHRSVISNISSSATRVSYRDSSNRRIWTVIDPDGVSLRPFTTTTPNMHTKDQIRRQSHVLPMGSILIAEEVSTSADTLLGGSVSEGYRKHQQQHPPPEITVVLSVTYPFRGWLPLDVDSGSYRRKGKSTRSSVKPLRIEPDRRCAARSFMPYTDFTGGDLTDGPVSASSPDACCASCVGMNTCSYWTYTPDGQCWLKGTDGVRNRAKENLISGKITGRGAAQRSLNSAIIRPAAVVPGSRSISGNSFAAQCCSSSAHNTRLNTSSHYMHPSILPFAYPDEDGGGGDNYESSSPYLPLSFPYTMKLKREKIDWTEQWPIGNGEFGALVGGTIEREVIPLSIAGLFVVKTSDLHPASADTEELQEEEDEEEDGAEPVPQGEPQQPGNKRKVRAPVKQTKKRTPYEAFQETRKLLTEGKIDQAERSVGGMMQPGLGMFQYAADLTMIFSSRPFALKSKEQVIRERPPPRAQRPPPPGQQQQPPGKVPPPLLPKMIPPQILLQQQQQEVLSKEDIAGPPPPPGSVGGREALLNALSKAFTSPRIQSTQPPQDGSDRSIDGQTQQQRTPPSSDNSMLFGNIHLSDGVLDMKNGVAHSFFIEQSIEDEPPAGKVTDREEKEDKTDTSAEKEESSESVTEPESEEDQEQDGDSPSDNIYEKLRVHHREWFASDVDGVLVGTMTCSRVAGGPAGGRGNATTTASTFSGGYPEGCLNTVLRLSRGAAPNGQSPPLSISLESVLPVTGGHTSSSSSSSMFAFMNRRRQGGSGTYAHTDAADTDTATAVKSPESVRKYISDHAARERRAQEQENEEEEEEFLKEENGKNGGINGSDSSSSSGGNSGSSGGRRNTEDARRRIAGSKADYFTMNLAMKSGSGLTLPRVHMCGIVICRSYTGAPLPPSAATKEQQQGEERRGVISGGGRLEVFSDGSGAVVCNSAEKMEVLISLVDLQPSLDGDDENKGGGNGGRYTADDTDDQLREKCWIRVLDALALGTDTLKHRHIEQFAERMTRTEIYFGSSNTTQSCPDGGLSGRLKSLGTGCTNEHTGTMENLMDAQLTAQAYQYGRYLLFSAATHATSNLQGLWADGPMSPWNGDYHMNINMQESYWAADVASAHETIQPLLRFIQKMVERGEVTAREVYGCTDGGWVAHGFTDNRMNMGMIGDAQWSLCVTCGAWLALHAFDHLTYTFDESVLIDVVLPALRGIAKFFLEYLWEDPVTHTLHTGPTTSPENSYQIFGDPVKAAVAAAAAAAAAASEQDATERVREPVKDKTSTITTSGRAAVAQSGSGSQAEIIQPQPQQHMQIHGFQIPFLSSSSKDDVPVVEENRQRQEDQQIFLDHENNKDNNDKDTDSSTGTGRDHSRHGPGLRKLLGMFRGFQAAVTTSAKPPPPATIATPPPPFHGKKRPPPATDNKNNNNNNQGGGFPAHIAVPPEFLQQLEWQANHAATEDERREAETQLRLFAKQAAHEASVVGPHGGQIEQQGQAKPKPKPGPSLISTQGRPPPPKVPPKPPAPPPRVNFLSLSPAIDISVLRQAANAYSIATQWASAIDPSMTNGDRKFGRGVYDEAERTADITLAEKFLAAVQRLPGGAVPVIGVHGRVLEYPSPFPGSTVGGANDCLPTTSTTTAGTGTAVDENKHHVENTGGGAVGGGGFLGLFGLSSGVHPPPLHPPADGRGNQPGHDRQQHDQQCARVSEELDLGHRHFSPVHYLFPGIFWPGTGTGTTSTARSSNSTVKESRQGNIMILGKSTSGFSTAVKQSDDTRRGAASAGGGTAGRGGKDIYEAGRMFMRARRDHGGGHTSWSAGWEACLWARLQDGESAMNALVRLLRKFSASNMLSLHPPLMRNGPEQCGTCFEESPESRDRQSGVDSPATHNRGLATVDDYKFQIDGNLGYVAAVSEMLLQSHIPGHLLLLPATPMALSERGIVRGLKARGQITVSMSWSGGQVTACVLRFAGMNTPDTDTKADADAGLSSPSSSSSSSSRVQERRKRKTTATATTSAVAVTGQRPHPWLLGLQEIDEDGSLGFFKVPDPVHSSSVRSTSARAAPFFVTGTDKVTINISSPNKMASAPTAATTAEGGGGAMDGGGISSPTSIANSTTSCAEAFSNRRSPGSQRNSHTEDVPFWDMQRFTGELTVSRFPCEVSLCGYGLSEVACRRELALLWSPGGSGEKQ